MDDGMKKLLDHVTVIELHAQDLLEEKQNLIEFNKKLNQTREALNSLKRPNSAQVTSNKTWTCYGNTFIKLPNQALRENLERNMTELTQQISDTRDLLKEKLNKVRDVEGKSRAAGFDLKGLSQEEIKSINKLL